MRTVFTAMLVFLLTACAGQRWYRDEVQFQGYVASLGLSQLSPAEAQAKLLSLGFQCESQAPSFGDVVLCTESVSHTYGGQTHIVRLSPSTTGTRVEASMSIVVV